MLSASTLENREPGDTTVTRVEAVVALPTTAVAQSPRQRLAWMDTLRGIAVFLVIYTHAIGLSPVRPPEALKVIDHLVSPLRIPALMFLSGMLLPQSLRKPRAVYLRGKVSRILWPYLLWSLVILAVSSFGAPGPDPLAELFWNPTSPMWFVGYLFVFYVVAMFLRPGLRTWLLLPTAVALVLIGSESLLAPSSSAEDVSLHRVFFTFFCFLAGDLLSRHQVRWLPVLTRVGATVLCALIALPALVMSVAGFVVRYQAVYLLSTLAGIVATIPLLTRLSGTSVGRFVGAQGRRSIVFYVTSFPAQQVAHHLATDAGVRSGLAITVINLAAGLAAGFFVVWLRSRLPAVDYLYDLHLERWGAARRGGGPAARRPGSRRLTGSSPAGAGEA